VIHVISTTITTIDPTATRFTAVGNTLHSFERCDGMRMNLCCSLHADRCGYAGTRHNGMHVKRQERNGDGTGLGDTTLVRTKLQPSFARIPPTSQHKKGIGQHILH
jgi:hypothetical protein